MTGVAADIRKNWNIFIDGKGYAGKADEYNPPELEEENEDYRAAGMDAAIDIRTGMKKLTSDFTLNSHSRDTLALFGVKQGKSKKAATAIAGAVANYKAKGGGKGPTAKQKAR